ncbi:MAG: adenylosuccinate synthase [Planctomycetaceae bacterium]|nr:adenylosuccinate synthase [Planctomycetaceae bacterium]MDG2389866.1 adenylosuccinate synthase [Planctomycetaceae bacterium]
MSATAVIGLQWGDEAKGKVVDLLTDQHDIVVRYLGGNNAGHTVKFDGKTYKLSLLPAGILHEGITSVIAGGVVINPQALLKELDQIISQKGELNNQLMISDRAHVIMPYHLAEERVLEASLKDAAIGTTMRGIGTCYQEKYGRSHAIRVGDLYRDTFSDKLAAIVEFKNRAIAALDPDFEPFDAKQIEAEYLGYAERLKPHVADTTAFLHRSIKEGKNLLFEGAQGSLLDIDHGTFPFVTSSNSSGCGIHNGSGVPEKHIGRMIGVVKAYTTRVGGGPFPTELDNEIGQHIRDTGNEYGTVTGRPRRCGWFDAVAAGYSARISGVDAVAVALLDVLDGLEELQICEAYEINGVKTTDFPSHLDDLAVAKPVYRKIAGWMSDTTGITNYDDLPENARNYVEALGKILEVPVDIVSVGPDREQTIVRR